MPEPARVPNASRVCRTCQRELPATEEYFRPCPPGPLGISGLLRGECRRCGNGAVRARRIANSEVARAARSHEPKAAFRPRLVGEGGKDSDGYTERLDGGYRFVCLPDSHGHLIDWKAAEAALAFVRYYRPVRIYLLGDHVDFTGLSRFVVSPRERASVPEDIAEGRKFFARVRESAPDAAILYLKGNHEARLRRYTYTNAAALDGLAGLDVPNLLGLADHGIEWEESGSHMATERLVVKHGNMVRQRSGYTATGELERNGVSGISGHTHRLGQVFKRNRLGMMTWVESGCLCRYDPVYMEGQLSDWQQGLSYGTVDLKGNGFSVSVAPIVNGRVRCGDREIGS